MLGTPHYLLHWTASPRNRHFNNLTMKTEFLLSFYDLKICINKDLQKESKSKEIVSQSCKFAAQRKKLENIPLPLTVIEITSGTFYKICRFIVYLLNIVVSLQPDRGNLNIKEYSAIKEGKTTYRLHRNLRH